MSAGHDPELEYRMERLREIVASVPGSNPLADAIVSGLTAGLVALPAGGPSNSASAAIAVTGASVGAGFAAWWAARRTPTFIARLQEALFLMVEELHQMQLNGRRVHCDDPQFLETIEALAPVLMRTPSEEKRRRYALLLAHTALEMDAPIRDQGRSMAILLEQLDEYDILLLDRVVSATTTDAEQVNERTGRTRYVALEDVPVQPEVDGPSWLRLHSLNLLQGADGSGPGAAFAPDDGPAREGVIVTSLGSTLHEWITERSAPLP